MPRKREKKIARVRKENSGETTTIEVAAKRLGIGINQAYEAARLGKLPGAFRLGKRWIVPVAALDRLLSGNAA
jgi:predicted site-specific integrase-resolvase